MDELADGFTRSRKEAHRTVSAGGHKSRTSRHCVRLDELQFACSGGQMIIARLAYRSCCSLLSAIRLGWRRHSLRRHPGPRTIIPGFAPVTRPSSTTAIPFTNT